MSNLGRVLCWIALPVALALAGSAAAQSAPSNNQALIQQQQQRRVEQPANNAPAWREVRSGSQQSILVPGREMGVLIQSSGQTWREIRNGPVTFYGGWVLVVVFLAIAAFYAVFGGVKLKERPTGRKIRRFSSFDQVLHWTVATCFVVLGLSGLIMLFGKHVLLPLIGYTPFGWLGALAKNAHNFIAPLFIVSVLIFALKFLRDNVFRSYDWAWLGRTWGYVTGKAHVPSGKFNAGEKLWFWFGVILLSIIVSWSGLVLLFPNFDQARATMQTAWIFHATAALIYIAISLGHIYLGTLGVDGAYQAMRTGWVDETWAKEHHEIWYEEVKSRKPSAAGGAVPAGAPHSREKP